MSSFLLKIWHCEKYRVEGVLREATGHFGSQIRSLKFFRDIGSDKLERSTLSTVKFGLRGTGKHSQNLALRSYRLHILG